MEGPNLFEELTSTSLKSLVHTRRFAVNSKVEATNERICEDFTERKTTFVREKLKGTNEGKIAMHFLNNNLLGQKLGHTDSPRKEMKQSCRNEDQILKVGKDDKVHEFENLKCSLRRIAKTQQEIKMEMNEAKRALNNKFRKIDRSYQTISSDVQELSHMVELARFVNNRIERVSIKDRLEKELGLAKKR